VSAACSSGDTAGVADSVGSSAAAMRANVAAPPRSAIASGPASTHRGASPRSTTRSTVAASATPSSTSAKHSRSSANCSRFQAKPCADCEAGNGPAELGGDSHQTGLTHDALAAGEVETHSTREDGAPSGAGDSAAATRPRERTTRPTPQIAAVIGTKKGSPDAMSSAASATLPHR
jgi:hypothetical protein